MRVFVPRIDASFLVFLQQIYPTEKDPDGLIGHVESLWKRADRGLRYVLVEVSRCEIGEINEHYGMVEFEKQRGREWIKLKVCHSSIEIHSKVSIVDPPTNEFSRSNACSTRNITATRMAVR